MPLSPITPATADTLWVLSDRVRFLGAMPGTDMTLIEVTVPPGSGTPPHTHPSAELFYVASGEITFGDFTPGAPPAMTTVPAGSALSVPSMAPHNYRNPGVGDAVMLVLIDPTLVAFFRDLGRAVPPATDEAPDFGAVMAAMGRHGIALAA